jgi:outer membrane protein OmpA-like peptidoglycan-associated protein
MDLKIMKKFFSIVFTLMAFVAVTFGQNPEHKSGITFKKLFLDYQSQNGGSIGSFKDYRHGFEIGFQRMLSDKVAIAFPARYGVVDSHIDSITCLKKRIASLDAQFQYQFHTASGKVIPYVVGGVGGVYEDEGEFNVQFPVGLGFYFRLAPKAFVHIQSEYRYSLAENRNNLQHGLGFTYLLGGSSQPKPMVETKKDSDNDGVSDELDLCPNAFGSKELNGCPDKDGDGIADYLDKCPEFKGLKEYAGCPDTDGDGIPDNMDECPKVVGTAKSKGCPDPAPVKVDSDGDGVTDDMDECPNEKGYINSKGCPDKDGDGVADKMDKCPDKPGLKIYSGCPDSDGDGIDDSRDKCPKVAGTVSNDGCPEIKHEDKKILEVAMQAVQFQTGSATLKTESYIVLNQIADIMTRYPDFNMSISGHTDNTGSATANQTLSERRAKACYDYLIKRGIAAERFSHAGFGESRPISSNDTDKGRSLNRRVEFVLVPKQ